MRNAREGKKIEDANIRICTWSDVFAWRDRVGILGPGTKADTGARSARARMNFMCVSDWVMRKRFIHKQYGPVPPRACTRWESL